MVSPHDSHTSVRLSVSSQCVCSGVCVCSPAGSDSLPGVLSPEDPQALRRRQGRQRHPSPEVQPPHQRPGCVGVFFSLFAPVFVFLFQNGQTETEPCDSVQKRCAKSPQKGNSVLFSPRLQQPGRKDFPFDTHVLAYVMRRGDILHGRSSDPSGILTRLVPITGC